MLLALVVLTAAGCGRYRFDPLERTPDGNADATPCAHTFCDDFDRTDPLVAHWDSVDNSAGATFDYATDAVVSAPQSYVVGLPFPQLEHVFLEKHLPAPTNRVRVELSLGYESTDLATAEIDLVQLQWEDLPAPCTSFGYYLVRDGTGPFDLQETYGGCGGNVNTPLVDLGNSGFHDVVLEVTLGTTGSGGTAMVSVTVDDATTTVATTHAIDSSPLKLRIGGGVARDIVAPWSIRYDNVVVDVE